MVKVRTLLLLFIACCLARLLRAEVEPSRAYHPAIGTSRSLLDVATTSEPDSTQDVWITVFVHGIMSIKPHLSVENFIRLMNDQVHDSLYAKTIEYMREDPVFFKNQPMQRPGLQPIKDTVEKGNASGALAWLMQEMEKQYGIQHDKDYYYTFGWSGLLSQKTRYLEAQRLFTALEKVVAEFQQKGINPKIRLFGYSHGGNVILNLGAVHQNIFPSSSLSIAQTILLGTPVQRETDVWVNDSVFEKVYHFYSFKDRVQPLDLFSSSRYFSHQQFKPRKEFQLPDKLLQINLKVHRPTSHVRKNHKRFELAQDYANSSIISGRSNLIREISPGHSELWFFAWTPMHYRKKYPLYPFPTVSYAPLIVSQAEKFAHTVPPHTPVVVDLRPDFGTMIVRPEGSFNAFKQVPLPNEDILAQLKQRIFQYMPPNYNDALYRKHTKSAFEKAHEWEREVVKAEGCR